MDRVQLKSLGAFVDAFTWSFTTGLAISTVLDIFITASLVILLRGRHQEFSHMNRVLDALVLYTFETGGVTTVATGVCLITWLTMPENLIFMALHFIISKCSYFLLSYPSQAADVPAVRSLCQLPPHHSQHPCKPQAGQLPFAFDRLLSGRSRQPSLPQPTVSAQ
jgi:hypothetical protein